MSKGSECSSVSCTNCGADLKVDITKDTCECQYCGAHYITSDILKEGENERIERIRSNTYKDIEKGKQQLEAEKMKNEIEREKNLNERGKIMEFKRSKFFKAIVTFSVISLLLAVACFDNGNTFSGVIAVVMTVLFAIAILMGLKVIPEKKESLKYLIVIIAFLLFVPFFKSYDSDVAKNNKDYEKIKWSELALGNMLPETNSKKGNIVINSNDRLHINIGNSSIVDFNDYVEECQNTGYTVEAESGSSSYDAFNEAGYKLELYYYDYSKEISISLSISDVDDDVSETQSYTEGVTDDLTDTEENTSEETTTEEITTEETISTGVTPEFKEQMDSYEEFYDEYIEFMNTYSTSSNPAELSIQYSEFLGQYTETATAISNIDENELSEADQLYFIEVQNRINQKLLDAAQ